jgi:N-acetylglutamate synthase-like GNAT family acetyltransferase
MRIRRAQPADVQALNELIARSKGHWGYEESVLSAYRGALSLTPAVIEREPVHCALASVGAAGTIAGVSHLAWGAGAEMELHRLFVEPACIGRGVGTLLWDHAVRLSRSMGAEALVFDSDPHARPFYEGRGAVVIGEHASTVVAGLRIPRMRYTL